MKKAPIRYLARTVEYAGEKRALSVATIYCKEDGEWSVDIAPFEREAHSTAYHGGTLRIELHGRKMPLIELLP